MVAETKAPWCTPVLLIIILVITTSMCFVHHQVANGTMLYCNLPFAVLRLVIIVAAGLCLVDHHLLYHDVVRQLPCHMLQPFVHAISRCVALSVAWLR